MKVRTKVGLQQLLALFSSQFISPLMMELDTGNERRMKVLVKGLAPSGLALDEWKFSGEVVEGPMDGELIDGVISAT